MVIDILTLFPKMFDGPFNESIIKRAQKDLLVTINIHDLRKWTTDKHKSADDRLFGGGVGMLLKVDVIDCAVSDLKKKSSDKVHTNKVILLDAGGKQFTHKIAVSLSKIDHLIMICGHYEGVDHRVHEHIADEVISIGDYILTGGEIPSMVLVDAISRQIPGVIVKPDAIKYESFSDEVSNLKIVDNCKFKIENLLESPQYTRPVEYKSWKVPETLLSGNHKEIEKWRVDASIKKTTKLRPDLIKERS
jgi:tRNA (guanine37-N1)-methyltransferase